jgi:hypothetical protein
MPSRRFKNLQAAREKKRMEESGQPMTPVVQPQPEAQMSASVEQVETVPVESNHDSANLMDMSPIERKALAQGIQIKVFIGDKVINQVHRSLLVAASTKGAALIDSNNQVHLSTDCADAAAVHILDWLNSTTLKNKVFAPRIHRELSKAIHIYLAAEELGMVRYIEHNIRFFQKIIREQIPSEEDLKVVEELCFFTDDPFMNMMADRIAYLIRKKQLPDDGYLRVVAM